MATVAATSMLLSGDKLTSLVAVASIVFAAPQTWCPAAQDYPQYRASELAACLHKVTGHGLSEHCSHHPSLLHVAGRLVPHQVAASVLSPGYHCCQYCRSLMYLCTRLESPRTRPVWSAVTACALTDGTGGLMTTAASCKHGTSASRWPAQCCSGALHGHGCLNHVQAPGH